MLNKKKLDIMIENAVKKVLKEENSPIAGKIFRKFGLRRGQLLATNDAQDEKVDAIAEALEDAGFQLQKSPSGGEYQHEYVKGNEKVMINYRFGKGYQGIWIYDKN